MMNTTTLRGVVISGKAPSQSRRLSRLGAWQKHKTQQAARREPHLGQVQPTCAPRNCLGTAVVGVVVVVFALTVAVAEVVVAAAGTAAAVVIAAVVVAAAGVEAVVAEMVVAAAAARAAVAMTGAVAITISMAAASATL